MVDNKQSYRQSDLKFSSSKLYFQHQNQILQKIWFISSMSTDIHFKYTFQEVQSDYFIEWGEYESLDVNHDIIEQWIIYKIGLLNPRFRDVQHIFVDLRKNILDNPSIFPLLLWLFWWLIVFFVLLWLYKYRVWQILFWINLVWALILLIFHGWKKWKLLYKKMVETKNVDYGGFMVNYGNQTDALMLSRDVIWVLKELSEKFWITKFCCTGNCIYLLQDIHDHEGNRIGTDSELYSEQEKASLQQRTMEYLRQESFLSKFMA